MFFSGLTGKKEGRKQGAVLSSIPGFYKQEEGGKTASKEKRPAPGRCNGAGTGDFLSGQPIDQHQQHTGAHHIHNQGGK